MRITSIILGLALVFAATQPAQAEVDVTLARAEAPLTEPWAFRLGHDPRWASPQFDDRRWERVDLTPVLGTHESDVGISGYVPGWAAHGHPGRWGHAWYRLRVRWTSTDGAAPVLVGPALVDGAYEIFWNGARIGGIGDFSAAPPRVFATRPQLYRLPARSSGREGVVAIHVYLPKELAEEAEAGGLHVAPILAEPTAGAARHLAQWWQTFWGYVVDLVEPVTLLAVALFAASLRRFNRGDRFLPAAAVALTAVAALRLNQPVFFWTEIESVRAYFVARHAVLEPLATALWIVACSRLVRAPDRRLDGTAMAFGVLTGVTAFLGLAVAPLHTFARIGLAVLFVWVMIGIARRARLPALALPAVLLVAIALFAEELWAIGVPGIWFPYGVGVSRSQFALALAVPLLAALVHFRAPQASIDAPDFSPSSSRTSGDVAR